MKKQVKPKEYRGHTSVSMRQKHIDILKQTAKDRSVSMNHLMILLLRFVNERALDLAKNQPRVKYQDAEVGGMRVVNLYIGQRDYERNIDARRFAKVSVSWLLAYAIDNFLEEALDKIIKNFIQGLQDLNNTVGLQTYLIKKFSKRIKLVSIWYPMRT